MPTQSFQLTGRNTQRSRKLLQPPHKESNNDTGHRTYHAYPRNDAPRTLRVLMVTPRYFPYTGGVENHVYQVARRLAHAGTDVTVLTTDPSGQLLPAEEIAGVKIQRTPAWPANRDYYFAPQILEVIRRGHWDLMHLQSYHTLVAPIAMVAAKRAHIPYLVTFHGGGSSSPFRNRARRVQQQMLRPLLVGAKRLIAVAQFEVDYYGGRLNLSHEHFTVIPNGCDLPHISAPPRPPMGTLIVSVGRLEQYKGHHRLIAALPYILPAYPNARLRIVGEGPAKADLLAQAATLGLADRVEIGGIPPERRLEMAETVGTADLFALLSDYETHPIAALEALSLKRPVLVADTSGLRELADRGLARSIPLQSTPQQTAAAVVQQLRNPLIPADLDLPTWDDCARELLLLYRSVTGRF